MYDSAAVQDKTKEKIIHEPRRNAHTRDGPENGQEVDSHRAEE
jgi:hypothetical protein